MIISASRKEEGCCFCRRWLRRGTAGLAAEGKKKAPLELLTDDVMLMIEGLVVVLVAAVNGGEGEDETNR